VLFPALRVGYLVVPEELWIEFIRRRDELDLFPPIFYQLVLTDFIREGHFARHLRRMRGIYLARRDALLESLAEHVAPRLEIRHADAGLYLTGFLPKGVDDREVVRRAAEHGIAAFALSSCYTGRTKRRSGLVLGFGGADERHTARAVRTLGGIIRALV